MSMLLYPASALLVCGTQAIFVVVHTRTRQYRKWLSAVVAAVILNTIGSLGFILTGSLIPLVLYAGYSTIWVLLLTSIVLNPAPPLWSILSLAVATIPLYVLAIYNAADYLQWIDNLGMFIGILAAALGSLFGLLIVYFTEHTLRLRGKRDYPQEHAPLVNRELFQPCPTSIHRHILDFDSPSYRPLRLVIAACYVFLYAPLYTLCILIMARSFYHLSRAFDIFIPRAVANFLTFVPLLIFSLVLLAIFNLWHLHKILVLCRPGWACSCVVTSAFYPPRQSTTPDPITPNRAIVLLGVPSAAFTRNECRHNSHSPSSFQTKFRRITSRFYTPWTECSSSTRSYTPIKVIGDGSFSSVWLSDWHLPLPPDTPLSAMQSTASLRPEWAGKTLVAIKHLKKEFDGGWTQCKTTKELQSLRAIPHHPNVVTLHDFFHVPESKHLYLVLEPMEGNLYHLMKVRKGRRFSGRLISSIFHQIVSGIDHIHASGYFHRDMKPENVLVTTTGIFDYPPVYPTENSAAMERDIAAVIKIGDFGLARVIESTSVYTEYVLTRWYRAPELLLYARTYSSPVDMWAIGTIMAEVLNLRPLFPGINQIDQISHICDVLGDPNDYGVDETGRTIGGGPWSEGVVLAEAIGLSFPKCQPQHFGQLFDHTFSSLLIDCMSDLLKYDPSLRLTSRQCLQHPYFQS